MEKGKEVMLQFWTCLVCCLLVTVSDVTCQTYKNATDLRNSLLSAYSTDIIPLNNYTDKIYVTVSLNLYSQPDIDPVRGSISTGLVLITEWVDERLSWTPSDHNGIEKLLIKSSEVWLPTISISQSMNYDPLYASWIRVKYIYNGSATYTPGDVYETSCEFYMKFWPFDKQTCFLTFYSFDYQPDQLEFLAGAEPVSTNFYVNHGEWRLDTDSIEYRISNYLVPSITFKLKYARQPVFYLLTVILPMNGIGALSCLVFLIPAPGGRIGFSVTIMLSLAVFLTVISDELPKTADPVPVMCAYILFGTLVNMIVTVLVILNTEIYSRGKETPISKIYLLVIKISRLPGNKIQSTQQETDPEMTSDPKDGCDSSNQQQTDGSKEGFIYRASREMSQDSIQQVTWQEVSAAIDRLLFIVTVVMTYIPSIILLIYVAAASDYHSDSIYWEL